MVTLTAPNKTRKASCARNLKISEDIFFAVQFSRFGTFQLSNPQSTKKCVALPKPGNYILRRFTTGSPSDETHWLSNKEMTKPCEVSDETSTNLFPHFQCQTLQCDTSTLNLRPGGRVRLPRVRLGVDLGGRGRGRRGGVFPKTTLNFLDSLQTRPDSTRPRPRSPIFISYPATRPPPTRPHTGEWRRAVLGAFHIVSR